MTDTFAHDRRRAIEKYREGFWPGTEMDAIDAALVAVDKHAITAFAHDLSAIPDEDADMIVENKGMFYYSKPENEEIYEQSIKEMLRILKPGGRILIGDNLHVQLGADAWYARIFDRMGLEYRYLERETSTPNYSKRYGLEITKPAAAVENASQVS
jgi:SAM-dependent methyltransferase